MPYSDPAIQREYQRQWMAKQRASYIEGKECVDCGATEDLELDHIDKGSKVEHRIWSWSKARREAEIAKCVVRCDECHNERHAAERRQAHGLGAYKRGCRCEVCRAAKAEKERIYQAKRRGRESNTPERICSPPPYHSATAPEHLTLFDLERAA